MDSQQIDRVFRDLECKLSTFRELDRYLGGRFNVFRYLYRELVLSRVIRDLLDPEGPHGQGDIFLKRFLEMLGVHPALSSGEARLQTEAKTYDAENKDRRIDITLGMDHLVLGIENKPWAGEQRGWVRDYSDHLYKKAAADKGSFLLVYLTRRDREAHQFEEDRRGEEGLGTHFKILRYEIEFKRWLELCYGDCRSPGVRQFLKQFIEFVPTMSAEGAMSQEETRLVLDYIDGGGEERLARQKIAYATWQAWPQLQQKLRKDFLDKLRRSLVNELGDGWTIDAPDNFPDWPLRLVRTGWEDDDEKHNIRLAKEGGNWYIGVWRQARRPDVHPVIGLDAVLAEPLGGSGESDRFWDWRRRIDERYCNWDDPEGLAKLSEPDALTSFYDLLRRLAEFAGPEIDRHYGIARGTE